MARLCSWLWLDLNSCLACPLGLALPDATALAWSWAWAWAWLALEGPGLCFALWRCLELGVGLVLWFRLRLCPLCICTWYAFLQTQNQRANGTLPQQILQCVTRGEFTATTAPLLPPSMFYLQTHTFPTENNDCDLCRHDRAATVWVTLTCNCPLTGQSWDNPNQDA